MPSINHDVGLPNSSASSRANSGAAIENVLYMLDIAGGSLGEVNGRVSEVGKPVRDPARLSKLLCVRIETIEPGFGMEKLVLVDILGNRGHRLFRVVPVAADVPERSVRRIAATAPDIGEA